MSEPYALILAAGDARRFGSPKQLAKYGGNCLLERVMIQAEAACPGRVKVVLGAHADKITAELAIIPERVVINNHWRQGLASSIRAGIESLPSGTSAALFLLGDQPLLESHHIKQIVDVWSNSRSSIVASHYDETVGVPALFPRDLFNELCALSADMGAKAIIKRYADRLKTIDLPEAALDIDTETQLQAIAANE